MGGHLNANDVMSPYAQRRKGFGFEWIDHMMPEDRSATPAEVATARMDIRAWLETLTPRNRAIASLLAVGESTGETAKRFGLSSGRISQIRGELCESWDSFQDAAVHEASRYPLSRAYLRLGSSQRSTQSASKVRFRDQD